MQASFRPVEVQSWIDDITQSAIALRLPGAHHLGEKQGGLESSQGRGGHQGQASGSQDRFET
eukprot:2303845-Pyramimonas_sp.AAC.1